MAFHGVVCFFIQLQITMTSIDFDDVPTLVDDAIRSNQFAPEDNAVTTKTKATPETKALNTTKKLVNYYFKYMYALSKINGTRGDKVKFASESARQMEEERARYEAEKAERIAGIKKSIAAAVSDTAKQIHQEDLVLLMDQYKEEEEREAKNRNKTLIVNLSEIRGIHDFAAAFKLGAPAGTNAEMWSTFIDKIYDFELRGLLDIANKSAKFGTEAPAFDGKTYNLFTEGIIGRIDLEDFRNEIPAILIGEINRFFDGPNIKTKIFNQTFPHTSVKVKTEGRRGINKIYMQYTCAHHDLVLAMFIAGKSANEVLKAAISAIQKQIAEKHKMDAEIVIRNVIRGSVINTCLRAGDQSISKILRDVPLIYESAPGEFTEHPTEKLTSNYRDIMRTIVSELSAANTFYSMLDATRKEFGSLKDNYDAYNACLEQVTHFRNAHADLKPTCENFLRYFIDSEIFLKKIYNGLMNGIKSFESAFANNAPIKFTKSMKDRIRELVNAGGVPRFMTEEELANIPKGEFKTCGAFSYEELDCITTPTGMSPFSTDTYAKIGSMACSLVQFNIPVQYRIAIGVKIANYAFKNIEKIIRYKGRDNITITLTA